MLQIYSCVRNVIEIVIIFLFVYKSLLYSVISLHGLVHTSTQRT